MDADRKETANAFQALSKNLCCVVVTADCEFDAPYRWSDHAKWPNSRTNCGAGCQPNAELFCGEESVPVAEIFANEPPGERCVKILVGRLSPNVI